MNLHFMCLKDLKMNKCAVTYYAPELKLSHSLANRKTPSGLAIIEQILFTYDRNPELINKFHAHYKMPTLLWNLNDLRSQDENDTLGPNRVPHPNGLYGIHQNPAL